MWQLSIPTEEEDGHLGGAEASLAQYYIISCCIVLSYIIVYHIRSHRIASHRITLCITGSTVLNITYYILCRAMFCQLPREQLLEGAFPNFPSTLQCIAIAAACARHLILCLVMYYRNTLLMLLLLLVVVVVRST